MKEYQFEVCANSVESCLAAQTGGANRVELCAGIPEGGTTPSYGEIAMARKVLNTARLHVIIRPRGGDFLYSPLETKIMLEDIEIARHLGVDGVVFGCLTANGDIDTVAMKELMEASHGLSVTFHRAFDVCRNPDEALEQIIELGCERILTSGQQPTAEQGIPLLKKLHRQAAGRIMPGNTKPRFLHRATILSMVFSVFFMVSSPFCLVAQSDFKIAVHNFDTRRSRLPCLRRGARLNSCVFAQQKTP